MNQFTFKVMLLATCLALVSCQAPPVGPTGLLLGVQPDSRLVLAASKGDVTQVEALLKAGANPNSRDRDGNTALLYAAVNGHRDIAELLIAHGADINAREIFHNRSALILALSEKHEDVGELLVAHGAAINASDQQGATPLFYAAEGDMEMMVELLVARGADVNATLTDGATPLGAATNKYMAEFLIAHGADVKDSKAILGAAGRGHKDVVEALIAHGADVNARNKDGYTALHNAANEEVTTLLIAHGADVNVKDSAGGPPLFRAAQLHKLDVAECLIAHGAAVNARMNDGRTPLFLALGGRSDMVNLLLAHGADVNAKNKNGETPLYIAVLSGNNLLLQRVAVAERLAAANRGLTLPGLGPRKKEAEDTLANFDSLIAANRDIVNLLLAHGADVNAKNRNGETPLDAAKAKNNIDLVRLLATHGAVSGTLGH